MKARLAPESVRVGDGTIEKVVVLYIEGERVYYFTDEDARELQRPGERLRFQYGKYVPKNE